jgi:hypothetical protein
MSDERADTDNRVVDVLWKLVAECLPDFFVRLASKTVGSSVTRDIRYDFEMGLRRHGRLPMRRREFHYLAERRGGMVALSGARGKALPLYWIKPLR